MRASTRPPGQARHHLRRTLADAGVLPPRDEQTERLETWVDGVPDPAPAPSRRRSAPTVQWKVLRTVRRRARHRRTTIGVADSARERIRAAARLLHHREQNGDGRAQLTQEALDRWTAGKRRP